jgi:hypothetical protein
VSGDAAQDIADRLDALSEELAELALDRLRTATASSGAGEVPPPELVAEERRITRARRAVEKAAALLRGPGAGGDADDP